MARRRVSEKDLLDFRARAETLALEVNEKYEEMDRRKAAEPEPVREMGLLILSDGEDPGLKPFGKRMEERGFAVQWADVLGYVPIDRFDRTPEWQRRLVQAQTAYLALRERAKRIAVLGVGACVPLAALIAEQYPVDALIAAGAFSGRAEERRGPSQIRRIAKNNLFSIVCPILTILPGDASPRAAASVRGLETHSRARDVQRLDMPEARRARLFAEHLDVLGEAILEFLAQV